MPAARRQNHRRSGADVSLNRVHFNGWIVNVDDRVHASRRVVAHVVLLGLAHPLHVKKRRPRRIERDHDATRQDRLRRVRRARCRTGLRDSEWRGSRRQRGSGSCHRQSVLRTDSCGNQSQRQQRRENGDSFHGREKPRREITHGIGLSNRNQDTGLAAA